MTPRLIVLSDRAHDLARLERAVGATFAIAVATASSELADAAVDVAVVGGGWTAAAAQHAASRPIVALAPAVGGTFVVPATLDDAALALLLHSLAARRPAAIATPPRDLDVDEARRRDRAFAASRRLAAAPDLAAAELLLGDLLADLIDADAARWRFFDVDDARLWSTSPAIADQRADRGIVAWVAWTGGSVVAPSASLDPRWHGALDGGAGDDRLLAIPVIGADGHVDAVGVAGRRVTRQPFTDHDAELARCLAALAAPLLHQLAAHAETRAILDERDAGGLFRREAVEAQRSDDWGELIHRTSRAQRWVHRALLVALAASIGFAALGRVHTYARGPAVVRMTARTELTARAAGNVVATQRAPGEAVAIGDPVIVLDDSAQAGEVARLEAGFDARLRERLLTPAAAEAGAAVAAARLELERARAALDERILRAPRAGIVGDIRVRPGQRVEPGDVVASVVDPTSGVELIAVVPGGDRPRLAPGQRMRLEIAGFRHVYQDVEVERVATEAMGSEEARRYLGSVAAGAPLDGPVVLVRAQLPVGFRADGTEYRFVDGMTGVVEIEIGSERIIEALLPGVGWR